MSKKQMSNAEFIAILLEWDEQEAMEEALFAAQLREIIDPELWRNQHAKRGP